MIVGDETEAQDVQTEEQGRGPKERPSGEKNVWFADAAAARSQDNAAIADADIEVSSRGDVSYLGGIEECIALLPADSTATIDEDFASDLAAAVAAHGDAKRHWTTSRAAESSGMGLIRWA